MMAEIDDYMKLDIRIGTVVKAEDFPGARKPAIKLEIDFGSLGVKRSSAQITKRYQPDALIGRQVVAGVTFPPRRIAGCTSSLPLCGGDPGYDALGVLRRDRAVRSAQSQRR